MRREKGKVLTTGDTKTYAGTRTITLPPSLAALLKERKRAVKTAWIFPDLLRPERTTAPDAAYRRMKLLLEQARLPDIPAFMICATGPVKIYAQNCLQAPAE